ncbi:MAG: formylglycine-generating enzyme family protein [Deltaproteobacteria bacterium]|nr:formylglycine-generating enzyme family protein [Deltaproteobacteria bacterium]
MTALLALLAPLLVMAPPMVAVGPASYTPSTGRPGADAVDVPRFLLDVDLVSRADFAAFVKRQPGWARGSAKALFVDERYLADWATATRPGDGVDVGAPVTLVSWFAARAYCAALGKRLPNTDEWELAAAASSTKKDARADPAFVATILDWYARPGAALPGRRASRANAWGARDLHGVVWEWVDDFGSALVTADVRSNDDGGAALFCGGAGSSAIDPADYAGFMRLAFRSSLEARFALPLLGFRCAKDVPR